jgi:hypothetical protein
MGKRQTPFKRGVEIRDKKKATKTDSECVGCIRKKDIYVERGKK